MISLLSLGTTAPQRHPDMGTFVGAILAVLLCATFWDAPKKFIVFWHIRKGEKYITKTKQELLNKSAAKASLLEQLEDIEDDFVESNKKIKAVIDWCYSWLYTPTAVTLGALALAELYLGKVQQIGYWNALLIVPFLLFLLPTFVCIIVSGFIFLIKRLSFESRLKKIEKKTQKRASNILAYLNENEQ